MTFIITAWAAGSITAVALWAAIGLSSQRSRLLSHDNPKQDVTQITGGGDSIHSIHIGASK